jgi:hypothetical protein
MRQSQRHRHITGSQEVTAGSGGNFLFEYFFYLTFKAQHLYLFHSIMYCVLKKLYPKGRRLAECSWNKMNGGSGKLMNCHFIL